MKEDLLLKQKQISNYLQDIDDLNKKLVEAQNSAKESKKVEEIEKKNIDLNDRVHKLELSLEDKEKTISDLKNQQVESKRVELITLERNLEDKHRLELEQVKSDSLAKMNDLRKKK